MRWSFLRRAVGALVTVDLAIAGLALMAMLAHVVLDVVLRELNAPISGTLEIVSFWYMVSLVFLAIPVSQMHGEHIKVELFTSNLAPRKRAMMDVVVLLFCAALLVLFCWVSTEEAIRQSGRRAMVEAGTGTLEIWPTRWLVPLSMGTTCLICVLQAAGILRALMAGATSPENLWGAPHV